MSIELIMPSNHLILFCPLLFPPSIPCNVGLFKIVKVLLLLLSHISRVWLCETPEMAAHQGPPSLGFSRQEHWSGLPFPSPVHGSEKWKWTRSVVSDSFWLHYCNPPDSSVHRIFQALILEWVAMLSSRGSSQPRDWTHLSFISCTGRWILTSELPGKPIYDLKYLEKTKFPRMGNW